MKFRCIRCGHTFVSRTSRERRCSKCRSRLILSEEDYNFILSKFRELEESRTPIITGLLVLNDVFRRLRLASRPVLTLNMLSRIARDARRSSLRRSRTARRTATHKRRTAVIAIDPLKEAIDKLDFASLENAIAELAEARDLMKLFPRVYYRELFPRIRNRRVLIRMWCYFDLVED